MEEGTRGAQGLLKEAEGRTGTPCGATGAEKFTVREGSEETETPLAPSKLELGLECYDEESNERVHSIEKAEVSLGDGSLPTALEEALMGMQEGERAVVRCPERAMARPGELLNSERGKRIVADVRLHRIVQHCRHLIGEGGPVKRRVRKGEGKVPLEAPVRECPVRAVVNGEEERAELGLGHWPSPVEEALKVMTPGEAAEVEDRDGAMQEPWRVELIEFERRPDMSMCPASEAAKEAARIRGKAKESADKGRVEAAANKLASAAQVLENQEAVAPDDPCSPQGLSAKEEVRRERVSLLASEAALRVKLGQDRRASQAAETALASDPGNAKALYNLAVSLARLGEDDSAREAAGAMEEGPAKDRALKLAERARIRGRRQEAQAFGGMLVR